MVEPVITVTRYGHDRAPVVVIDNFFTDPSLLVDDAAMVAFGDGGLYYPGIRAAVHPAMSRRFVDAVTDVLAENFGLIPVDHECHYSLVTTPPDQLSPAQCLPHIDSVDPTRIALLHFLSSGDAGGTAFYRHRSTGFEMVTGERHAAYQKALATDILHHGLPTPGYIAGDTPMFEELVVHKGRFNRALLYQGNTLHCARIPADMTYSPRPDRGRLTVNSFIQCKAV